MPVAGSRDDPCEADEIGCVIEGSAHRQVKLVRPALRESYDRSVTRECRGVPERIVGRIRPGLICTSVSCELRATAELVWFERDAFIFLRILDASGSS